MVITEMFLWWYKTGWITFIRQLRDFLASLADYFSMSSILRTLFQPYRQISANNNRGQLSLEAKFHAFTDRLISRCIGFVSRLFLLIIGLIIMIVSLLVGTTLIIAWPVIPLLPIAGIILTCSGFIV